MVLSESSPAQAENCTKPETNIQTRTYQTSNLHDLRSCCVNGLRTMFVFYSESHTCFEALKMLNDTKMLN